MLLPYHVRRCTTLVSTQIVHKDFDLFEYLPVHFYWNLFGIVCLCLQCWYESWPGSQVALDFAALEYDNRHVTKKVKKCICSAGHTMAQLVKALHYNPEGRMFEVFHWFNPSGRTITFGSVQPLTEMSTVQYLLGVQTITFICRLSRNSGSLNLLEPERPVQALLRDNFVYVLLFGPKELIHVNI